MKKTREQLEALKTPGIFRITWSHTPSGNICESRVRAKGLVDAISVLYDEQRNVGFIIKWEKEQ